MEMNQHFGKSQQLTRTQVKHESNFGKSNPYISSYSTYTSEQKTAQAPLILQVGSRKQFDREALHKHRYFFESHASILINQEAGVMH